MGSVGLSERLSAAAGELSPTEEELARHLTMHADQWGFARTSVLADSLGVHRSTMGRFAQRLGYSGLPELREAVRAEYLKTVTRPMGIARLMPDSQFSELVHTVYSSEMQNLRQTYARIDGQTLERTAHELARAKRVIVFGRRFSYTIAMHTSLLLRSLRPGVILVPDPGGSSLDAMFDVDSQDAAIVFSLRRHSPEVQRAVDLLVDRQVPTTLITDAAPLSNVPKELMVLQAHIGSSTTVDSYTSLVSLGHALAVIVKELLPNAVERQALLEESRIHFQRP